jgi:tetratricopeptide (TPR) repeat protein
MLNVIELESRWLRYKIKSYLPHFVILLSLGVIITASILLLNSEERESTQDEKEISSQVEAPKKKKIEAEAIPKVEKVIETVPQKPLPPQKVNHSYPPRTLVPSMDFMKGMQNSSQPEYENPRTFQKAEDKIEEVIEEIVIDNTIKEEEIQEDKIVEKKELSKKISIKRQNTQNDIIGIIKRFKKNKNPALSLFVAKKYYELGDYHNAYNYALITNEINRDIEASWIVFSKSLVKLGKKDMAAKTLKEYIKESQSYSAQILLDEIESGQFK